MSMSFEKLYPIVTIKIPIFCDLAISDLQATKDRDSACKDWLSAFLYYKGFHAIQFYRIANWLWEQGRSEYALFLQSQVSKVFGIDIHPQQQKLVTVSCSIIIAVLLLVKQT